MTPIVLCTSGGVYGALVLAHLLRAPHVKLAGIVLSTRVLHPSYGWLQGALVQLRRSGAAYTLYLGCATTLADLLGRISPIPSVPVVARRQGIPLIATRDINSGAARDFVADLAPDLLVSAFFNQRIGTAVRDLPALGAVNIHPSLLPAFRGVDPVFFARLRGASELGVSLHRVAEDFDTGPLLTQQRVTVPATDSAVAATARLFVHGAQCLVDCLPAIRAGDDGEVQMPGGDYDSWPKPADVQDYHARGHRLARVSDVRLLWGRALGMLDI